MQFCYLHYLDLKALKTIYLYDHFSQWPPVYHFHLFVWTFKLITSIEIWIILRYRTTFFTLFLDQHSSGCTSFFIKNKFWSNFLSFVRGISQTFRHCFVVHLCLWMIIISVIVFRKLMLFVFVFLWILFIIWTIHHTKWHISLWQVFYAMSVSTGGLVAMASFNQFNNNVLRWGRLSLIRLSKLSYLKICLFYFVLK